MTKTYLSDAKIGDSLAKGWNLMGAQLGPLILVVLINSIIGIGNTGLSLSGNLFSIASMFPETASVATGLAAFGQTLGFLVTIVGIFLVAPIAMSVDWVFLRAAREEKYKVGDMFAVFNRNYWNAVGARIITNIIIVVGFIFLIIPGIIFAIRLSFVNYIIIDEKASLGKAISESWKRTEGHFWTIFGLSILALIIYGVGILLFGVGFLFAVIWVKAAFAVLYMSIMQQSAKKTPATTTTKKVVTKKVTTKKTSKKTTTKKSPAKKTATRKK